MISIIMPCYRCAATVSRSITSVLEQSHPDFELIVVDDGSTDDSLQHLEGLASTDRRIRVIAQLNQGPGAARNRGLAEARGEHIAFLDADDYWAPTFLERMLRALTDSGADLAYCGWQNIGVEGGKGDPHVPPDYNQTDLVEAVLKVCPWPIHGVLTRAETIHRHGGFNEEWTSSMDYDLWLRLSRDCSVTLVPEVLAFYVHHSDTQITSNRARILINHWRIQRRFITEHPEIQQHLGRHRTRELTHGHLLDRAFECYWKRQLQCARPAFRIVMAHGYGRPRDWLYMLPSLLPLAIHRFLIDRLGDRHA